MLFEHGTGNALHFQSFLIELDRLEFFRVTYKYPLEKGDSAHSHDVLSMDRKAWLG
jgi:hypothetical protein